VSTCHQFVPHALIIRRTRYITAPRTSDSTTGTSEENSWWEDYGALANFWVRTSRLATGIDARLLAAIQSWFAEHPRLGRTLFVTNEEVRQQVELFEESGLRLRFRIERDIYSGTYLAYDEADRTGP